MNMQKPMTGDNYDKLTKRYSTISKEIAEETMSYAAEEIRSKVSTDNDEVVDDRSSRYFNIS